MGRVAGPYGVRGWMKVASQGDRQALAASREWWIGAASYEVTAARVHGASLVAKLAGVETPEQAAALKGSVVSVRREALPEPEDGHYYFADLVGLEVVNAKGEALGVVKRLFWNGAHDVMEVAADGATRLLPWVPTVVRQVDLSAGRIRVEWEADW